MEFTTISLISIRTHLDGYEASFAFKLSPGCGQFPPILKAYIPLD